MPSKTLNAPVEFTTDLDETIRELREAIVAGIGEVDAPVDRPQEIGRRLELDKNLVWKVSKIATAPSAAVAGLHVPGIAAMRIFRKALERHGASADSVSRVRAAADRFEALVQRHAGDRVSFELLLHDLLPPEVRRERLEAARKLAFQGNSTSWGVQASLRLAVYIVSPSRRATAAEGDLDISFASGVIGFRRIRSTTSWPLFEIRTYEDEPDTPARRSSDRALAPSAQHPDLPLFEPFCSRNLPTLRRIKTASGIVYELPPGPVGRTNSLDLIQAAHWDQEPSMYRDEHNRFGEYSLRVLLPCETLQLDVLVHRDLPLAPVEAAVHSDVGPQPESAAHRDQRRIPIVEELVDLGSPPALESPHYPRQVELVDAAMERLDRRRDEFRGWRFTMRFPPTPSVVLVRHPLLERP